MTSSNEKFRDFSEDHKSTRIIMLVRKAVTVQSIKEAETVVNFVDIKNV